MSDLIILEKPIRQQNGLYCLNDLHKASGGESRHRPNNWLQNQQTIEFIKYLSTAGIPAVKENQQVIVTVNGGHFRGTYGNRKVALAYATWISPEFFSLVLDVFDGVVSGSLKVGFSAPLTPPETLEQARALFSHLAWQKYQLDTQIAQTEPWLRYWTLVELSQKQSSEV